MSSLSAGMGGGRERPTFTAAAKVENQSNCGICVVS